MEHSLAPSGRGFTAPEGGTDRWHTFAALWRDLPAFSRYAGHLLLLVVFALLGQRLLPQNLRIPRLGAWLAPQMVLWAPHEEDLTLPYYGEAEPEPRYLERGAVPLTLRLTGETRRIGEPERQVRTSVIEYTVQKGDSVLSIAQMFGLKSTSILWANGTLADNPDFLRVGQKLNILPVDGVYHTVAKGETLDAIAAKYKVRPEDILGYGGNHLTSASDLQVGQKLIIPGGVMPIVPRRVTAYSGPIPEGAKKGTGRFGWPMSGRISQSYSDRHRAIDIAAPIGTPIYAADSGFVVSAQWTTVGYGRMIVIDHGNGFRTLYAHLNAFYVEVGQSVAKGEKIGECGRTGNSTGPHLHFEIIQNGVRRNPLNYLQ